MWTWVRSFFDLEPPPDPDAVCASAPLGFVDAEVVDVIGRATQRETADSEPADLLDANVVAIVHWWNQRHRHLFDGSGRYVAVVPTDRTGLMWAGPVLHFMARGGVVFSFAPWETSSQKIKPGQVVTETRGTPIGSCHEAKRRLYSDTTCYGYLNGPDGQRIATVEEDGAEHVRRRVMNVEGEVLARVYQGKKSSGRTPTGRRYGALVVEFLPRTTAEIRALTLAYVFCEEIRDSDP